MVMVMAVMVMAVMVMVIRIMIMIPMVEETMGTQIPHHPIKRYHCFCP